MPEYRESVKQHRRPDKIFLLTSRRTADPQDEMYDPEFSLDRDGNWVSYYAGKLEFGQAQEIRAAAENPDPRDPDKTIWSEKDAITATGFSLLQHPTTEWNLEVRRDQHGLIDNAPTGLMPLARTPQSINEHIDEQDIIDLGRHNFPWVKKQLGINDENTLERLSGPLGMTTKAPMSETDDDESGSSGTTSSEEVLISQAKRTFGQLASVGNSEESPSLVAAG